MVDTTPDPAPGQGANYGPDSEAKDSQTKTAAPVQDQPTEPKQNNIVLTDTQFEELIKRLNSGNTQDKIGMVGAPGSNLQVNPFGAVVGTVTKYNVDPDYYPNPVEALLEDFDVDDRMRRHNVRENYFITWEMTSKPYQTKDNMSVQEPTFHSTLYSNEFDDQGEPTGRAIVVQTLHFNEDEELARNFAADKGFEVTNENLRELMDRTRYSRMRAWLIDLFYPPRNFELNVEEREEAIGGTVVKVVTKSNVKGFGNPTPKIRDEELQ